MKTLSLQFFLVAVLSATTTPADVIWSGKYRFEGVSLHNPSLDDTKRTTSYGLNHLIMDPRIIASDGIEIRSRFHILNTGLSGAGLIAGNQLGQVWGGESRSTNCRGQDCPPYSQAQGLTTDLIQVSQLYARWIKDYQELVIGRAPLHFGLGMAYHEGNGLFDHWLTTRDLLAYRLEFGNLWLRPMLAKTSEGSASLEDDMTEFLIHGQYENPASGLAMGLMYTRRFGDANSNRSSADEDVFDPTQSNGPALARSWESQLINIYLKRILGNFRFGFEAGFSSGKTGFVTSTGQDISLDAYGMAAELEYDLSQKFIVDAKVGIATGDDPSTADRNEGFTFHRNYDVGMLLFNFALGNSQANVFGNGRLTRASRHAFDGESVANTLYVAPGFNWIWNEAWGMKGRFFYAKLTQTPISGMDSALGFEVDTSIVHKPMERMELRLDLGVMTPGNAFKVGNLYKNETAIGLMTKAAITF